MRQLIQQKEEEIENYRLNSKVMKYAKLEFAYNNTLNEYNIIKKEYDSMQINFEGSIQKYKEILEEKENFKNAFTKVKSQFEEIRSKMKTLEEENKQLYEIRKTHEYKISHLSKVIATSNNLKNKDRPVISNTESSVFVNSSFDNLKTEKSQLEKKNADLLKEIKILKEKLEKPVNKVDGSSSKSGEEINRLNSKIGILEKDIISINAEKDSLIKRNKEITETLNNLRKELEKLRQERNEVEVVEETTSEKNGREKEEVISNLRKEIQEMQIKGESIKIEMEKITSK